MSRLLFILTNVTREAPHWEYRGNFFILNVSSDKKAVTRFYIVKGFSFTYIICRLVFFFTFRNYAIVKRPDVLPEHSTKRELWVFYR